MPKILTVVLSFFVCLSALAQGVWMHPNRGQWDGRVRYKVELQQGEMLLENNGFTYHLFQQPEHAHDNHSQEEIASSESFPVQVIRSRFLNSSFSGKMEESDSSSFYRNYFLGNDQSTWKSEIHSVGIVEYKALYAGIDLIVDGHDQKLKYSYRVSPGANVSNIAFQIDGADRVELSDDGELLIHHRFGHISESKPIAWTEKDGKRKNVKIKFVLDGNVVRYALPESYDETATLIIDPYLVFSSFTGSLADNWGFTAAPDPLGNLFAGGIVFGAGYPTTTGAFDASYSVGNESGYQIDVGLTKFNSTGTSLLYSTYLGGQGNETPHSIVCAPNGELFVFGVTSSSNFPMGPSPFDNSFSGGPTEYENSLNFTGSDIYIARFNPTGTGLLASTYVGGSGTDGLNTLNLHYNYGDQFRGEIILDANNNVYIASTTQSSNFPVVQGTQTALSGAQDAVIFKMPTSLNTMTWSTFFGGSGNETGYSIQVAPNGEIYVAGGTNSALLPMTVGNDLTYNGGLADGYVARFNPANGAVISGTFMGLNEYDQTYFVQLDLDNNAYVFGQSQSPWPMTPGLYGMPNSGQFIRKYDPTLNTILWTTMVGAGTGNVEISPTAFLVSDCYEIYFSGWGGTVNHYASALNSTTNGFQVTADAFQTMTNGSNFYIAVLEQDASLLKYATYMGGLSSSSNHVDGGTSRFDKSGRIYHAVCGACGGNDYGFTSTPGVWSPTNNSSNCNLAAYKFELNTITAVVTDPDPLICLPDPVVFSNNSANGNSFFWDFGDNTTSTEVNPIHLYNGPGEYTVTLVVADSNGCYSPDSVEFIVNIGDFQGGITQPSGPICPGVPTMIEAFGGTQYSWTPTGLLNDPTSPTPVATIYETTVFTVVVYDSCGTDTLQLTLPVYQDDPLVCADTSICIGGSANLSVVGNGTFLWSPSVGLSSVTSSTPIATPTITTEYMVQTTSLNSCVYMDSVTVSVYFDPPVPVIPNVVPMCFGGSVVINVSGAETYIWSPAVAITPQTGPLVTVSPAADFTYYCDFINACGVVPDSVFVDVISATVNAGFDTIVCPGESALIWAAGGVSYVWTPSNTLSSPFTSQTLATPTSPTVYTVIGTDATGCTDSDSVFVDLFPQPFIQTCPDVFAMYGDAVQLSATSTTSGSYIWSPAENLSCVVCVSPIATPSQTTTYTVSYTDANGCSAQDNVTIHFDPMIFVPNTFTPDGNEFNQAFHVVASNISSLELMIFDRWGELIFTMDDVNDYWDGSYNGVPCQDGTYTWKLSYWNESDEEFQLTGHVNLLR